MSMHHWLKQRCHHPPSSHYSRYVSSQSPARIHEGGHSAPGLGKIDATFNFLKTLRFGLIQLSRFMQTLQPEALPLTMSASPSNLVTPLFRNGGLTHCEGWHRNINRGTHTDVCWLGSGVVVRAPRLPTKPRERKL